MGKQLSEAHRQELLTVLTTKFGGVMQSTRLCYYQINTSNGSIIASHAYRESV